MPSIPDYEFQDRIRRAQQRISDKGLDALLCYGNEAEPQFVRYFSDYWPSFETAGVLIPAEGKPLLLIGPESFNYASDRSKIPDIRLLKAFRESSEPEYPGKPLDTFLSVFDEVLGGRRIRRIGVAGLSLMTVGVYGALREVLDVYSAGSLQNPIPIEKADTIVSGMRMIKSENELNCMRAAAKITRETMDYVIEQIRPGMTETQVVGLALGKMHELGAERESYPLWVLTGKGSHQAISRPRQKVICSGDMTFLQFGARVAGYASSIGRTVVFGKMTSEQRSLIDAGYRAQEAVIHNLRTGALAAQIARAHEENVRSLGYGEWLLYGPCHGNGLMEGEAPWIETTADFTLETNMTFCVDIFLGSREKEIGLRMEDVACVKPDGAEILTDYPRLFWEL